MNRDASDYENEELMIESSDELAKSIEEISSW